jgi:hypothetical protein
MRQSVKSQSQGYLSFGGHMRPRIKSAWVLSGLIATMAMGVGHTTQGGAGIVITKAHSTNVGDPYYDYLFAITINASTAPGDGFTAGSEIVITGLTGISTSNGSAANSTIPDWFSAVPASPIVGEVIYAYTGPTITSDTNYSLGSFYVGPTNQYSVNASPPTPTIDFTGYGPSPGGGAPPPVLNTGNIGVTFVPSSVPEPSSAILLFGGCGIVSLILVARKARAAS